MVRLSVGSLLVLIGLLAVGCGSSGGYSSDAHSAITTLSGAITTYNAASPRDVQSTGASCKTALDKLSSGTMPSPTAAPEAQKTLADILSQIYAKAKRGFTDCATAGRQNDYVLMARSTQELAGVNVDVRRARSLDH